MLWNRSDVVSTGQTKFQSRKNCGCWASPISREIASRFCFQMEMRGDCSRDMVLEPVFFIRIGGLLSAFHFSLCNCALKNRLWFLMREDGSNWTYCGHFQEKKRGGACSQAGCILKPIHLKTSALLSSTVCRVFHRIKYFRMYHWNKPDLSCCISSHLGIYWFIEPSSLVSPLCPVVTVTAPFTSF